MKKIIFLLIMCAALTYGYGQKTDETGVVQLGYSPYILSTDTATNTGDVYLGVGYTTGGYRAFKKGYTLAVQPYITQLTGTSAGSVLLQGSIDGTHFVTLNSGNSDLKAANDTLSGTTGANTLWVTTIAYPYYRVLYDASGSHTSTLAVRYYLIKPE